MTVHWVGVPPLCPECGATTCVEYAGHALVGDDAGLLLADLGDTTPYAVHCGAEHDGDQDCGWRQPINVPAGASYCIVRAEGGD